MKFPDRLPRLEGGSAIPSLAHPSRFRLPWAAAVFTACAFMAGAIVGGNLASLKLNGVGLPASASHLDVTEIPPTAWEQAQSRLVQTIVRLRRELKRLKGADPVIP